MVLHGADDPVTPPHRSEPDMALFPPGTNRQVLQKVGHFMPREAPGSVVDALRKLLRP